MLFMKSSSSKIALCHLWNHFHPDHSKDSTGPKHWQVFRWKICIFYRFKGDCTQATRPSTDKPWAGLSVGHLFMDVKMANWYETLIPSHSNSLSIPGGSMLVHNGTAQNWSKYSGQDVSISDKVCLLQVMWPVENWDLISQINASEL